MYFKSTESEGQNEARNKETECRRTIQSIYECKKRKGPSAASNGIHGHLITPLLTLVLCTLPRIYTIHKFDLLLEGFAEISALAL
jgi:hypothetical protein